MANGYEQKEQDAGGTLRTITRITRAMAFDYALLKERYGISLDVTTSTFAATAEEEDNSMQTENVTEVPAEQLLPF